MNKVVTVEVGKNYMLFIKMADGKSGIFDVSPYLNKGIFKELQNEGYFKQVTTTFGGVAWANGQDFSADTIDIEMKQQDKPKEYI